MRRFVAVGLVVALAQAALGGMVISEWMYNGTNGEFVEFTNVGSAAVDMTDWSYSDTDAAPFDLLFGTVFGVVQPGESVILTDAVASDFQTAWGLAASVKIFGSNTNSNLGRSDMINLYDAAGTLVDTLTYNDQAGQGPQTKNKSCNIPGTDYGYTIAQGTWVLASVGDVYGSWASSGADVASPGIAPIPEPSTLALVVVGGLMLKRRHA